MVRLTTIHKLALAALLLALLLAAGFYWLTLRSARFDFEPLRPAASVGRLRLGHWIMTLPEALSVKEFAAEFQIDGQLIFLSESLGEPPPLQLEGLRGAKDPYAQGLERVWPESPLAVEDVGGEMGRPAVLEIKLWPIRQMSYKPNDWEGRELLAELADLSLRLILPQEGGVMTLNKWRRVSAEEMAELSRLAAKERDLFLSQARTLLPGYQWQGPDPAEKPQGFMTLYGLLAPAAADKLLSATAALNLNGFSNIHSEFHIRASRQPASRQDLKPGLFGGRIFSDARRNFQRRVRPVAGRPGYERVVFSYYQPKKSSFNFHWDEEQKSGRAAGPFLSLSFSGIEYDPGQEPELLGLWRYVLGLARGELPGNGNTPRGGGQRRIMGKKIGKALAFSALLALSLYALMLYMMRFDFEPAPPAGSAGRLRLGEWVMDIPRPLEINQYILGLYDDEWSVSVAEGLYHGESSGRLDGGGREERPSKLYAAFDLSGELGRPARLEIRIGPVWQAGGDYADLSLELTLPQESGYLRFKREKVMPAEDLVREKIEEDIARNKGPLLERAKYILPHYRWLGSEPAEKPPGFLTRYGVLAPEVFKTLKASASVTLVYPGGHRPELYFAVTASSDRPPDIKPSRLMKTAAFIQSLITGPALLKIHDRACRAGGLPGYELLTVYQDRQLERRAAFFRWDQTAAEPGRPSMSLNLSCGQVDLGRAAELLGLWRFMLDSAR